MKGLKTGGRTKGTPNRKTQGIVELITEKFPNYHPLISLAEIANDFSNDVAIRLQANKEIAKYICPQLKAIAVDVVENQAPHKIDLTHLTFEELTKLISE